MLAGFTAGLLLITLSELGDKTFFIGAVLAMRYPRRWVFLGVTTALCLMTIISVLIGQLSQLFPQLYVQWTAVILFWGFGLKLIVDAIRIHQPGIEQVQAEALATVRKVRPDRIQQSIAGILSRSFLLTFAAEWGDRTQLATITLATANHPIGVILGGTLGHALCSAIAVISGKLMAGYLSERWLMLISGVLFIGFGCGAAFPLL